MGGGGKEPTKKGNFWRKEAPTKGNLNATIYNFWTLFCIYIPLHGNDCDNIIRDDCKVCFSLLIHCPRHHLSIVCAVGCDGQNIYLKICEIEVRKITSYEEGKTNPEDF